MKKRVWVLVASVLVPMAVSAQEPSGYWCTSTQGAAGRPLVVCQHARDGCETIRQGHLDRGYTAGVCRSQPSAACFTYQDDGELRLNCYGNLGTCNTERNGVLRVNGIVGTYSNVAACLVAGSVVPLAWTCQEAQPGAPACWTSRDACVAAIAPTASSEQAAQRACTPRNHGLVCFNHGTERCYLTQGTCEAGARALNLPFPPVCVVRP